MKLKEKEYEIGGRKFVHRPMVLGQVNQLMEILQGVSIPAQAGALELAMALGNKLSRVIAILLSEKGKSLKDKDLEELTDHIATHLDLPAAVEVAEDFFGLNPLPSVLGRLTKLIQGLNQGKTGSSKSPSSSPAETSPKEMKSSGDIP